MHPKNLLTPNHTMHATWKQLKNTQIGAIALSWIRLPTIRTSCRPPSGPLIRRPSTNRIQHRRSWRSRSQRPRPHRLRPRRRRRRPPSDQPLPPSRPRTSHLRPQGTLIEFRMLSQFVAVLSLRFISSDVAGCIYNKFYLEIQ